MPQKLKIVDLTKGQKFGKLVVLHTLLGCPAKGDCECRCECGVIKTYRIHNLVGGLSTSCGCTKKGSRVSLQGKTFGNLVVLHRDANIGRRFWVCRCVCGDTCTVGGTLLRRGQVKGCGCLPGDTPQAKYRNRDEENLGKGLTLRLKLFYSAQRRARKNSLPFTITLDDIVIPEKCPILGIPLFNGRRGFRPHSYSLDRIQGPLGYVPGNVQVISNRANLLKRDATLEELEKLVNYLKLQRERLNEKAPKRVMQQSDLVGKVELRVNINDQFAPNAFDPGGEIGGAVSSSKGHPQREICDVKSSLIDSKAETANEAEPIRDRERLSEMTPVRVMQQSAHAGM